MILKLFFPIIARTAGKHTDTMITYLKENKYYITSIGLLLTILLYGWHFFFRLPLLSVSPFSAVPVNAALLLSVPDTHAAKSTIDSLKDIQEFSELYPFSSFFTDLRQLQEVIPITAENPIVTALQQSGRNKLDWIIISDLRTTNFDLEHWVDTVQYVDIQENIFRNFTVFDLENETGQTAAIAQYRNLIIYGRYSLLVEDAISQIKNPPTDINRTRAFRRTQKMLDSTTPIQVYLNFNQAPQLLAPYITSSRREEIAALGELASWLAFSIDLDQETATIDEQQQHFLALEGGLIKSNDNDFLHAFGHNSIAKNESIQDILPNNIVVTNWFGVNDFQHFYKYLNQKEDELFREYFLDWIGEEFAYVVTEPFGASNEVEKFVVFKIENEALAKKKLREFEENVGLLQIYDYQMFTITQLTADNLLQPVFGEQMNSIQQPFYTLLEDYVVFGNSRAALEVWIDKYLVGQTLSNDTGFLQVATALNSETSLFTAFHTANMAALIKSYFKPPLRKKMDKGLDIFKELDYVAFNGNTSGSRLYLKGKGLITEKKSTQTGIAWKTPIKNRAATAPTVIRNKATKQYDILVQDIDRNLYLLNQGGGIVWEQQLTDSIVSKIHAIDYYKNGQTQYLFNTPNQIFLLNSKGEHVGSFPINLQSSATAGVAVVDFDRNRAYSFFVPCSNGYIYGFGKTGLPLTGWNPRRGAGIIKQPLQHFQRNGKDYLIAFNDEQKVLAFKRDGEYRFRSTPFAGRFPAAPDWQVEGSSPRVVLTNTEGNAYITNLFGESFRMYLPVGANQQVDFAFCDIVGDARNDYIVLSDSTLAAYYYHDDKFDTYFQHQFKHVQDFVFPVALPDQQKYFIGTLSSAKKQINLLTNEGNPYPDFPLAGTSEFTVVDLFDNEENVLVVANGESVYAYRLRK